MRTKEETKRIMLDASIELINQYLAKSGIKDARIDGHSANWERAISLIGQVKSHYSDRLLDNISTIETLGEYEQFSSACDIAWGYFISIGEAAQLARKQPGIQLPCAAAAPAHVVSSIPVPLEKDLKIINSYLKAQKIKHVVSTTMDPQIALELCGKIAESYDKLLKAKKLDKARELLDARARVESYFSERLAKLRGTVVAAAAAAPSVSESSLYRTSMTEQFSPSALAATGLPAAPIYDGASPDDDEMISDSPPLLAYAPQGAPTPMVFMGPGGCAAAPTLPDSPPSYEAAEAMRCISLAEQLGFDEMELLAAMAVINSVPGIRAKLSLDIDSNAGIMIVSDASRYAGNFHISVPKERRKEILSANKLLRSYFDKLGYDDSSSASQVTHSRKVVFA